MTARVSPSTSTKIKKSRIPSCCPAFCTFVVFGLIVVPIAVFAISAFFAVILYFLECAEATPEQTNCEWHEETCVCSYFQWWIYIVGNLVGVSITEVGPGAGHVLSEIIDLLIAVWSITIAGLVIGLVGGFTWVGMLTEEADSSLKGRFDKVLGLSKLARDRAAGSGLTFADFVELCAQKKLDVAGGALRELFDSHDANGNGTIDAMEVEKLLEKMQSDEVTEVKGFGAEGGASEALVARMDAVETKIDAMESKLDEVLKLLKAMK